MAEIRSTYAIFDGETLKLEDAAGLETNRRYRVTIEEIAAASQDQPAEDRFRSLMEIANEIGFTDFAEKHLKK